MFLFVGLMLWGASISELNVNGGKAVILFIPMMLLGIPWEMLFGPEGSATFSFWISSALLFYFAKKHHHKSLKCRPIHGPPRHILSEEDEKSNFWGVIISISVVSLIVFLPVIFALFVS